MSEPSLALQKAMRQRLAATSAVTALVPASAIMDRNARPEVFPCILIGEGQTGAPEGVSRHRHEVYADLHLWKAEAGLVGVKTIAGAVRAALADMPRLIDQHRIADLYVQQTRFLRDPDGVHSHGVLTVAAVLVGAA